MAEKLRYYKTAERPDIKLWLLDDDGALINMASGYTFALKIGLTSSGAALLTKTSGITGAAGAGTERTGAPNVTIVVGTNEFATLPAKAGYNWELKATTGGADRYFTGRIDILDTMS